MQKLHTELTSEAITKYFAAFPALKKGQESPPLHLLPPPAWCRKPARTMHDTRADTQQRTTRERRHSHRPPKKNKPPKRRCLSYQYNDHADSKENLPEWVTHEAEWDLESQDPVAQFIRALARDAARLASEREMFCDEITVPDWGDCRALDDLPPENLAEDDSYAKFEAKFDSSIEALWRDEPRAQLESPLAWRYSPASQTIWSLGVDTLHDQLEPLHLGDEPGPLCSREDILVELPSVASTMRSLTALNHSKTNSSFVEVLPRRASVARPVDDVLPPAPHPLTPSPEENLLTSARTHFRPIGDLSPDGARAQSFRYADGDKFEIDGELDVVKYERSESGSIYIEDEKGTLDLYYEFREDRCAADTGLPFSLKFRARQIEKGIQTEEERREACDECSRLAGAKKMRPHVALESIWSEADEEGWCGACAARDAPAGDARPLADEWSRDWEELVSDIGAAHARYAAEAEAGAGGGGGEWWRDRKRRHSAAVWCHAARCSRPHHAPFLLCCAADRPLTR